MQPPVKLSLSGAGIAFAPAANSIAQLDAVLVVPDNSATPVALDVSLYASASAPQGGVLPSEVSLLGTFTSSAGEGSYMVSFAPDGIGFGGYIIAQFNDTGAAHALFCYMK